jgi:hypothetical protein
MSITEQSIKDREFGKFVECAGEIAVRTKICQEDGESIAVRITDGTVGTNQNYFFEASSVASGTTTIATHTVGVGDTFFLKEVFCSGDNIAYFEVFIDTVKKDKARTWWTDFNVKLPFGGLEVSAGSTIEVKVTHASSEVGDFNAKLIGSLNG